MFLQASVILSTGGEGGSFFGGVPPNFRGGCLFLGGPPNFRGGGSSKFSGGVPPNFRRGGSSKFFLGGGSPLEYGQRSAGMHPTGMHSCTVFKLNPNLGILLEKHRTFNFKLFNVMP